MLCYVTIYHFIIAALDNTVFAKLINKPSEDDKFKIHKTLSLLRQRPFYIQSSYKDPLYISVNDMIISIFFSFSRHVKKENHFYKKFINIKILHKILVLLK